MHENRQLECLGLGVSYTSVSLRLPSTFLRKPASSDCPLDPDMLRLPCSLQKKEKTMKTKLGAWNCLFPLPAVLIGANVNGKPNYFIDFQIGSMAHMSYIYVSSNKTVNYTNIGIRENKTFSINIPSVDSANKTDYCGLVHGNRVDKAALFQNFYGKLETAPMIEEFPINMECKLIQTLDIEGHDVFIGELAETYCDEGCLVNGMVDFSKVRPILGTTQFKRGKEWSGSYWTLGERFAEMKVAGKEFMHQQ